MLTIENMKHFRVYQICDITNWEYTIFLVSKLLLSNTTHDIHHNNLLVLIVHCDTWSPQEFTEIKLYFFHDFVNGSIGSRPN